MPSFVVTGSPRRRLGAQPDRRVECRLLRRKDGPWWWGRRA